MKWMNVVLPVELQYKHGDTVKLKWKMNMDIATKEEETLVVVLQSEKNATWDLVPMEPVSHEMNRFLKLNLNIIFIQSKDAF